MPREFNMNDRVLLRWPTDDADELAEAGIGPVSVGTIVGVNARDYSYDVMFDNGAYFPFSAEELVHFEPES